VNEEINYSEVRLILDDGTQFGIVSSREAMSIAQERGLDLIEISPMAKPPVCRIVDYNKFRFERAKKDKEVRKKQRQSQIDIKELKFRPKIEEHDYNVKLKHIRRFLTEGDKVKLVIRYRGREIVFQSSGLELLNKILKDVEDIAVMEKKPEMLGRQQVMVISSRPGIDKKEHINAKSENS
jgi:translation initiation factor IF-3